MLFFPGALSQFFATVLFFIVVVGGGYAGVKIYYQNLKITALEKQLDYYESAVETIDQREALLTKNIELLKRNCNRDVKSLIIKEKLEIDGLFKNDPK